MTTVGKDNFGGGEKAGGGAARGGGGAGGGRAEKNPWNRVWQVPLLLAGLVAFGVGVRAVVKNMKQVPFSAHVQDVQAMLAAGKYDEAIGRINTLGDYFKAAPEQATLQELAGDAYSLAQQKGGGFVRENYQRAADHYRKAAALGTVPDATMNERWGDAALAIGDAPLALEKLDAAIVADPTKLAVHARDLIAAHVANGDIRKAQDLLTEMVKQPGLDVDERSWAWCKQIELALAAGDPAQLKKTIGSARGALKNMPELDPAGRVLLWIGRGEFETGQLEDARRDLEDARKHFVEHHLDYGRTAVLLAKIAQARGDVAEAGTLYQDVAIADEGTTLWPAARFGRAEVLALTGHPNQQMQEDYRFVIQALKQPEEPGSIPDATVGGSNMPEMVKLDQVRASLVAHYEQYAAEDRLDDALLFLSLQSELKEPETAAMAYRLATTKERRGAELLGEMRGLPAADAAGRAAKTRAATTLLADAAEDYLRHAKLTTMDDATSGNSVWRAAQLFDQAGRTTSALTAFRQFTMERPRDSRVPEGLLAMGRLYQSIGDIDSAIPVYQRNIAENAKTPAAYVSAVNLARCYMAQGPSQFDKAEKSLLSLVQDNLDLGPKANEFRVSLFTLGELYYNNGRWADAILRLEESIERYPEDPGVPRALFMLGESYRKSAGDIQDALRKNPAIEHRDALAQARVSRLRRAAGYFARVIGALDMNADQAIAGEEPRLSPLEEEILRTSYMDRAECYFQLGDLPTAIKCYDQTATRFAQRVAAIESYVQIVNAYVAMNEPAQADAAAERAEWILKRIPDEAFAKTPAPASRQYYEEFFKLGRKRQGAT